MSNLKELSYHVAPEDQGQFVEYAFAYDWENGRVIQRVTDRSGARTYYYAAPAENLIGEWEPWNRAPQFARGTEWQRISPEDEEEGGAHRGD